MLSGRFVYMNAACAAFAGIDPEDLLTSRVYTDEDFWPKDAARFKRADRWVAERACSLRIVEPATCREGESRPMATHKVPVFDDAGAVIAIAGFAHDLTDSGLYKELIPHNPPQANRTSFLNQP
jgi:PAS domain S-box-containing protein